MTMETRTVDYVIDCGLRQATMLDCETMETRIMKHVEILELPHELPAGSFIVSEYAHLGCPQSGKSLAQVFTETELLDLYKAFEDNDITFRLFPHQSTPRALCYSKLDKSDENDTRAIYKLLTDFPRTSLMKPPKSFEMSNKRKEAHEFRTRSTDELNLARAISCKYENEEDANYRFLMDNVQEIYDNLSEHARDAFGFTVYKRGNKKEGIAKGDLNIRVLMLKASQIFSILVQFQDYDGELRTRESTGELPGWDFIINYVLSFGPFHFKGGVARSNLKHHGEHNWVAKKIAEEMDKRRKEKVRQMELAGETVPKDMTKTIMQSHIASKRRGGYKKKDPVNKNGDSEWDRCLTPEEDTLLLEYRAIYKKAVKEFFMICKSIHERRVQHGTSVSSRSSTRHPADKLQTRMVQGSILT